MRYARLPVLALLLAASLCAQSLERAEALWKQRRYQEANDEFRRLVAASPANPDYRVRWGRLFLDRFQKKDAADLFREALGLKKDHAGALLGLALVYADDFDAKAVAYARQALEADPKLVPARELLARLALEDGDEKRAVEESREALAISPDALDALAVLASIDWLHDKPDTPWMAQVLQRNPKYGHAYEIAANFMVLNRRYEDGIKFYRKALELQPDLWSARSQLGVNLMRIGEDAEAREQLVKCYENDYRDNATVNSLRLLDTYKDYKTYRHGNIILKLHKKEADLLEPYFEAEVQRALRTYNKKYKLTIDQPVQVEVYPNHEDFAVRTLGMPGLGALGVTFGRVVAMDSPSARTPGSFHWASTLWHELSHVYTLTATNHRIPRWFTEGMAVHEETAVSPEWGDRLDPGVIKAIKEKKLLPIAELDRGFVRPSYPNQVVVSYYQAGKICDYIANQWGYDKLLAMMHDFASDATTSAVVEKELGMKPEEFDKRFLASVEAETKRVVENFDDWRKQMMELTSHGTADPATVIEKGKRLVDIYPDFVEHGSAYELVAEAYLKKGDKPAAIAELDKYAHAGGRSPATLKRLATLLEEAGRPKEAASVLDRLNYIAPLDPELHQKLGGLWLAEGNVAGAIREFRAVLAENPLDQATSHYNLARALRQARRDGEARDQVIAALEAAPDYRPAQKLLLELSKQETESPHVNTSETPTGTGSPAEPHQPLP